MRRRELYFATSFDYPRCHHPIRRRGGICPKAHQGVFVGAAFELAKHFAGFASDQFLSRRQRNLGDHTARLLAGERALGDIRGQIAGVLHCQGNSVRIGVNFFFFNLNQFQLRRGHGVIDEPIREFRDFAFQ